MRILDNETDKKLDSVMLFLTRTELQQLLGYATQLLEKPSCDHCHLTNDDYQKEITICIYEPGKANNFDKRTQKLIECDE